MAHDESHDQPEKDKRNRGTFEMIAALLSICNQPTNRNQIMQRANFSSTAVKYYLRLALQGELVELLKDGRIATTAKGREVIAKYDELLALLRGNNVQ